VSSLRGRAWLLAAAVVAVGLSAGVVLRLAPASQASEARAQVGLAEATAGCVVGVPSAAPEVAPVAPAPARCAPEPPLEVPERKIPPPGELFQVAKEKPEVLGSASVGTPTRGSLFGGVELKDSEGISRAGGYPWGTESVVRSIERAVREVRRCFLETPRLYVGDIAREGGGWLKPHRSHQSGLDADLGYYYTTPATWYMRATAQNLDVKRTWALVRALIEGGNVEMIFMDVAVQRLLKAYLATLPEAEQPKEELFSSPTKRDTVIRHAWGHLTHFHVRFSDPSAIALGNRLADLLPRLRAAKRTRR